MIKTDKITGQFIKEEITPKLKMLKSYDTRTFTLNKKVQELSIEIAELRKNCPHEFQKGQCIYCGLIDKEDN